MSRFTPAETVVLKRLAREAVDGLPCDTGEYFAPRQRSLTYSELYLLRKMADEWAAEKGKGYDLVDIDPTPRVGYASPRAESFERPKTSELLTRAADMIYNYRAEHRWPTGYEGFIHQLRDRAEAFKQIEDTE